MSIIGTVPLGAGAIVVYSDFRSSFYFRNAPAGRRVGRQGAEIDATGRSQRSLATARSEGRLRVILAVLALTEINSAFEVGMVYGVIGSLVRDFGASAAGWVVSSFLLSGRDLGRARLAPRRHLRPAPSRHDHAGARGHRLGDQRACPRTSPA